MNSSVIAIDLAKDVFEVAVSPVPGRIAERHRFSRRRLEEWISRLPAAIVLLEACGTAHHWGRFMIRLGHSVVLIPPHIAHRYGAGNKTDRNDCKAILEAYRNEEVHAVPVKSEEQQGLAGLHRLRTGWVATRTARINEARGLLREFGLSIPMGADRFLERASPLVEDADSCVPVPLREGLRLILEEIVELDSHISRMNKSIAAAGRQAPVVATLRSVPGIGVLTATAALTSIIDPKRFKDGRRLASSLGLTPREFSSGKTRRLGRITKRGDRYLRTLLIHGGRSVLRAAKTKKRPSRLEAWAIDRERVIGHNKAAVAVANKLARLIWAVWTTGAPYEPRFA